MYDWFDDIRRIRDEMDRIFQSPFLPAKVSERKVMPRVPNCHVFETETAVIADIELPGVEKKDIDLRINEQSLEIKVDAKKEVEKKTEHGFSYSSARQSFYRYIPLPKRVIPDKAEAEFKNGLLRVNMPKAEKASKGRSVPIK